MRVEAATPEDVPYLTERTGYHPGSGFRGVVARRGDGTLAGFVGFDGWTPAAVWLHVAVDAPGACRGLLRAAFSYAFVEAGRSLLLGSVRAGNARSLALAQRLGFSEVVRLRDAWGPGEDVVFFEMRREACRWLEAR